MKKRYIIFLFLGLLINVTAEEASLINREDSKIQVFAESELGVVKVNYHTLLIGNESEGSGTTFNYVIQGGQDILYRFERWS